jgi:hypothetical protein
MEKGGNTFLIKYVYIYICIYIDIDDIIVQFFPLYGEE